MRSPRHFWTGGRPCGDAHGLAKRVVGAFRLPIWRPLRPPWHHPPPPVTLRRGTEQRQLGFEFLNGMCRKAHTTRLATDPPNPDRRHPSQFPAFARTKPPLPPTCGHFGPLATSWPPFEWRGRPRWCLRWCPVPWGHQGSWLWPNQANRGQGAASTSRDALADSQVWPTAIAGPRGFAAR